MSAAHRTQVCTGDPAAQWSRLIVDLERHGLLSGPGAFDAVARVGADVLDRAAVAARADVRNGQPDAP